MKPYSSTSSNSSLVTISMQIRGRHISIEVECYRRDRLRDRNGQTSSGINELTIKPTFLGLDLMAQ